MIEWRWNSRKHKARGRKCIVCGGNLGAREKFCCSDECRLVRKREQNAAHKKLDRKPCAALNVDSALRRQAELDKRAKVRKELEQLCRQPWNT